MFTCNLKKKSSGFSRFGGNSFMEYLTSNSICNHEKENVKSEFLEIFELLDHINKRLKFIWFKYIHGAYFWSVGVGATSPLSPYRHCHQSGGGPATDRGEGGFLRHLHEWCRAWWDPRTHQVHQVIYCIWLFSPSQFVKQGQN